MPVKIFSGIGEHGAHETETVINQWAMQVEPMNEITHVSTTYSGVGPGAIYIATVWYQTRRQRS